MIREIMNAITLEPIKLNWMQLLAVSFAIGGAWYMLLGLEAKVNSQGVMIIKEAMEMKNNAKELNGSLVNLNLTMREVLTASKNSEKERASLSQTVISLDQSVDSIKVELAEIKVHMNNDTRIN